MIKIWSRVPDKCTFELSCDSESEGLVASARVLDNEGTEIQWTDEDLRPGPATLKVRSPHVYSVRIRLGFMEPTPAQATIRAQLVKPDGSVFGSPYEETVEGRSGDIVRADILVATLKG